MKSLPGNLYTPEAVARLDQIAIKDHGIPGYTLMRRAGQVVFDVLQKKHSNAKRVLVFCGAGNNAGDGYVIARLAHKHGLDVKVVSLIEPEKLKNDALQAFMHWKECGEILSPDKSLLENTDIIIDALLGTGLTRDVSGEWQQCINDINDSGKPVIAVDVPSGLNAGTGAMAGAAIIASETVTFIGLKKGLFTGSGRACSGEIIFDDLSVPEQVYDSVVADAELLVNESYIRFPQRSHDTHKGKHGHVLIPGGNTGMPGAVILAARAALRSGVGVVSVVTLPKHVSAVVAVCPEAMVYGSANGEFPENLMNGVSHIAIGPGLGQDSWAQRLLYRAIESEKPLILDADALNLIATHKIEIKVPHISTPHPGEAARLLSLTSAEVQNDRFAAIEKLQALLGGSVVLKGSGSLVYDGNKMGVCPYGGPAMASAGMGDVLTGIIAALFAQGLSEIDAVISGVCIHSCAADRVASRGSTVLASDVIDQLQHL